MRAARIAELGQPPEPVEIDGDGSIEITAAALNPLDLSIASGRWYGGHPPLPYIPGCEAVGRRDGERVYLFGDGRGTAKDGFLVERVDFPDELAVPLPDSVDDALAAAAGVAGLAGYVPVAKVAQVRPGDRVVVLGATGSVGTVAVQAAKLLGAERVVAAGRDEAKLERALERGADAIVQLGAAYGEEFDVVIDPLWGEPLVRALDAAARGARIVHIGQSAGAEATLASGVVRGKQLRIFGYSNFGLSPDERRDAYLELIGHVAAGKVRIDFDTFPLERVGEAWAAQERGEKAVVTP
jgi:NADPH:quinone reductase-like Zn-dependent oxidoreductase